MKFRYNASYDYEENNISEQTGYTKWYDWIVVKKHIRIINIILTAVLAITAFLFRNYLTENGILNLLITLFLSLVVWLLIITPLHEFIHLIPECKFNFDNRCIITFGKGTASAIYNGHTKRWQMLLSLILPFIALGIVLFLIVLLTSGHIQMFFVFLLVMSCYGSYTDLYMFFYCIKAIQKNDIIFGLYKKTVS